MSFIISFLTYLDFHREDISCFDQQLNEKKGQIKIYT